MPPGSGFSAVKNASANPAPKACEEAGHNLSHRNSCRRFLQADNRKFLDAALSFRHAREVRFVATSDQEIIFIFLTKKVAGPNDRAVALRSA